MEYTERADNCIVYSERGKGFGPTTHQQLDREVKVLPTQCGKDTSNVISLWGIFCYQ